MIIYQHKNYPENVIMDSSNEDEILDWITKKYAACNKAFIKFGDLSLNALRTLETNSVSERFFPSRVNCIWIWVSPRRHLMLRPRYNCSGIQGISCEF